MALDARTDVGACPGLTDAMVPRSRRRAFSARLQRIDGKGGWYHVTVPPALTGRTARTASPASGGSRP